MFVCQLCKKDSEPHEKPVAVVLETRTKVYPARYTKGDLGGKGFETVKEVLAHAECAAARKA